jgi:hypothetical protein
MTEKMNNQLFQYLLWGQTTRPCRFRYLSEYQTWAAGLGFDPEACREPWNALKSIYRSLYGEPEYYTNF